MISKHTRGYRSIITVAGIVAVTGASLSVPLFLNRQEAGQVTPACGSVIEYGLPNGTSPIGITAGPDGNMWFAEGAANKIGKITTGGAVSHYSVPTAGGYPAIIASGSDGYMWFTENLKNKIGKIALSNNAVSEYTIPTANSGPAYIAKAPDGSMWFTESNTNKIGRITSSGQFTEYTVPTPNSVPLGIAAGPDGNMWFTERQGNKIGIITPAGAFTEYSVPTNGAGPFEIAQGPDGSMWFTEYSGMNVGKITANGIVSEYYSGNVASLLGLAAGPDGNMWFVEHDVNKIGKIPTTGGPITHTAIPSGVNSRAYSIAKGPDGNMWFTETGNNNSGTHKIGKVITCASAGSSSSSSAVSSSVASSIASSVVATSVSSSVANFSSAAISSVTSASIRSSSTSRPSVASSVTASTILSSSVTSSSVVSSVITSSSVVSSSSISSSTISSSVSASSQSNPCGNGTINTGETCDDGGRNPNDGCSATCAVESGYTCTGAPSQCLSLSSNLQAYWKFDEAGGTRKASVGTYDLSVWNANIGSGPGKIGLSLAPNVYYGLRSSTPLGNANRSFTVATWVYFIPMSLQNDSFVIASGGDNTGAWTWMLSYRFLNAGRFNFSLNNNGAAESVEANTFGFVRQGVWNYVVASYNASSKVMSISVNAGQPDTHVFSGTPRNGSLISVGIDDYGIWGRSQHAGYIAQMDEMGMWGRALSAANISELYNGGVGNTVPFLGTICGNGIAREDEECDDGNQVNTDACTNNCKRAKCGDAYRQQGEDCDDGNGSNYDTCTNTCKNARCGDTFLQPGEQCDDGNQSTGDACPSQCRTARCGDGFIQSGVDQCDDGNNNNNDGCNATCRFEPMTRERCLQNVNKLWDSARGCIDKIRCYEYNRTTCPSVIPSNYKPCKVTGQSCVDDYSRNGPGAPKRCNQMNQWECGNRDTGGNLCIWTGSACTAAAYYDRCINIRDTVQCLQNDLCLFGKQRSGPYYIGYPYCSEKNTCTPIRTQANCTNGLRANIYAHCVWNQVTSRCDTMQMTPAH